VYTRKPADRGEDALERAIFSATPNILVGPVTAGTNHFVFEVKQIKPAHQRTLVEVRGEIEATLVAEQRQRTLAAFVKTWEVKWIARTNCAPGLVVSQCRQYAAKAGTRRPSVSSRDSF
jgi:diaminopimelate epimerase